MYRITLISLLCLFFCFFQKVSGEENIENLVREFQKLEKEQILILLKGKHPDEEYLRQYTEVSDKSAFEHRYFKPFEKASELFLQKSSFVDYPASFSCVYNIAPAYLEARCGKPDLSEREKDAVKFACFLTGNFKKLEEYASSPSDNLLSAWAYGQKDKDSFRQAWNKEIQSRPLKVLSVIAVQKSLSKSFFDDLRHYLLNQPQVVSALPLSVKLKIALKCVENIAEQNSRLSIPLIESLRNDKLLNLLSKELNGCEISIDIESIPGAEESLTAIQTGFRMRLTDGQMEPFMMKINGRSVVYKDGGYIQLDEKK